MHRLSVKKVGFVQLRVSHCVSFLSVKRHFNNSETIVFGFVSFSI